MSHANRRYDGLADKWRKAPYSEAEFAKAIADQHGEERCSFCGRYHFEIETPMAVGHRARICGECIGRLHIAVEAAGKFPT